jgi:hypothetical protein
MSIDTMSYMMLKDAMCAVDLLMVDRLDVGDSRYSKTHGNILGWAVRVDGSKECETTLCIGDEREKRVYRRLHGHVVLMLLDRKVRSIHHADCA